KGIDISRNVQVVLVLFDFTEAGDIGVFINAGSSLVGVQDFLDVGLAEQVLVFTGLEIAAGVDKQHLVVVLGFFEQQNCCGNACAVEQLFRQADNGIQQVFIDQLLANPAFAGATE